MEVCCVLCGVPAASRVITEHGNRYNFSCVSAHCGKYVISGDVLRRLESGAPQKSVLIEMVRRANKHDKALEIFVAGDGMQQVTELPRSLP